MSVEGQTPPLSGESETAPALAGGGLLPLYREYKHRAQQHRVLHAASLSLGAFDGSQRRTGGRPMFSRMASNPSLFEDFFPSPRKFMWHHAASYWMAVLFVQGSLLFTFAAGIELFEEKLHWRKESIQTLTMWPNLVGGVMFNIGAYCAYLNLINLKKEPNEAIEYLFADWARVRMNNSEGASRVATMAYFVGATIYSASVVTPFFHLPWVYNYLFGTLPGVAGSVCFVLGGICELIHNGVCCNCSHSEGSGDGGAVLGHRSTCRDAVWWISILNTIGGVNFLLGYLPGFFLVEGEAAAVFQALNFFVGSMTFVVSSWLLVVMWEHDDYGGALIRQLNNGGALIRQPNNSIDSSRVSAARRPQAVQQMSVRGAFFIGVYCWLSCASIVNACCLYLWDTHSAEHRAHPIRDLSMASTQVLVVVGVFLVITLHSTVVSVPKEEPYRTVVIASRFIMLCGAIGQTICFLDFVQLPFDSDTPALALLG